MADMGRPRKLTDLPPRMHQKGKAFYYVTRQDGKTKWMPLGSDKGVALAEWAKLEGETCSTAAHGTVAYCIDRYMLEIMPSKTPKTQRNYARSCEAIKAVFGKMPIASVKPQHLYQYLDMHPKPYVANRDVKLFSVVFGFGMRWGLCDKNPCAGVKRHAEPPRDRYISQEEMCMILDAATPRMRVIIEMAYATAMRKSDLLKIMLSDIKDDGLYVRQGKTGKRMIFEWSPTLRNIISEAKKQPRRLSSVFLFTTRAGTPYTADGFDSNWQRIIKKLGLINIHFHDIRGTAITDAKNSSGIDNAQALAGHKNSSMTEQYVRQRNTQKVKPIG